jgi:hypothetical protein
MVPGRPAWCTPLTLARFGLSGLAVGGLVTAHRVVGVVGVAGGLAVTGANLARLGRRQPLAALAARVGGTPPVPRGIEWWGTVRLALRHFRKLSALGAALSGLGLIAAAGGPLPLAIGLVAGGELIGRYLFYVTVVPLDMPGSFYRSTA